jgi:oligosaccharide repeat unit polymerase
MFFAWIVLSFFLIRYTLVSRLSLFSPTSIFLNYIVLIFPLSFIVSQFFSVPSGLYLNPNDISLYDEMHVFAVLVICILSFFLGRSLFTPFKYKRAFRNYRVRKANLIVLVVIYSIIAVYSFNHIAQNLGGASSFLSNIDSIRSGALIGLGPFIYFVTIAIATLFQFALIRYILIYGRMSYTLLFLCIISSFLGGIFGFRGVIGALLIQLVIITTILLGVPRKKTSVFLGVLFIFILIIFALNRYTLDSVDNINTVFNTFITRLRGVENIVIMLDYIENHDFKYFIHNIYETLTSIIPRLLIEKPISVSEMIATEVYGEVLYYNLGIDREVYGGIASTYIGESLWNFGYAGVVIVSILIGYAFKAIEYYAMTKTILSIIILKAISGNTILLVESSQLGINAIIVNIIFNLLLYSLLIFPIFKANNKSTRQYG